MNIDWETLMEEMSRDKFLAVCAAAHIAAAKPMEAMETEPLEALTEMIRQELQDRDLRSVMGELPVKPF